jgi:hypothetical protein
MSRNPQPFPPIFHIDVTADAAPPGPVDKQDVQIALLRQMLMAQDRQNKLLEELIHQVGAIQRQRLAELGQWKQANPGLARRCKAAVETLSKVQNEFLRQLTEEVAEQQENLLDGEFVLNEFVDRFGPRLAHLNGVVQALSQLSHTPDDANAPK